MRLELLEADVAELQAMGLTPPQALRRGLGALGARPTYERLRETAVTPESLQELVHFYADQAADLRLLRFTYATRMPAFERARRCYEGVEQKTAELRRRVVPELKARLRAVREEEEALERALRERGLDPGRIGPRVPPAQAIDPRPMPWEGDPEPLTLSPPPVRSSLRERVLARLLGWGR
ncbi:MAG: hypothetical protein C4306_10320 [Thermoleophilia bacterium]